MPAKTETPDTLYGALASVQASLPKIGKGETAQIPGKDGKPGYSYRYANLTDISERVLPLLGAAGLSWVTRPTFDDSNRFVLAYGLYHSSGESLEGSYPLPSNGTPQQIGSAITYARRYCLTSVTGVAPDEDDDDGAAASHVRPKAEPEPEVITDEAWAEDYARRIEEAESVPVLRGIWPELNLAVRDRKCSPADVPTFKALLEGRAIDLQEAAEPTALIPDEDAKPSGSGLKVAK